MGLFGSSKKSGALPNARTNDYYLVPKIETYMHLGINVAWFQKELNLGVPQNHVLNIAMEMMQANAGNVMDVFVARFLGLGEELIARLDLKSSKELANKLEIAACMGAILAVIEISDGAKLAGKIHPSIWNARCLVGIQFFGDISDPGASLAIGKSCEIGYLCATTDNYEFSKIVLSLEPLDESFKK